MGSEAAFTDSDRQSNSYDGAMGIFVAQQSAGHSACVLYCRCVYADAGKYIYYYFIVTTNIGFVGVRRLCDSRNIEFTEVCLDRILWNL